MSDTVIRNVVIRTSIEGDRTRMESGRAMGPGGGASGSALNDLRNTRDELRKNEQAHEHHAREIFRSSLHAIHGITSLSRGIALMAASGEEDVEKLARKFVYLEGVVSAVKGGIKLTQFAAEFGQLGLVMGGVAAAFAAAAAATTLYEAQVSKAKEQVISLREEGRRLQQQQDDARAAAEARDRSQADANAGAAGSANEGRAIESNLRRNQEQMGLSQGTLYSWQQEAKKWSTIRAAGKRTATQFYWEFKRRGLSNEEAGNRAKEAYEEQEATFEQALPNEITAKEGQIREIERQQGIDASTRSLEERKKNRTASSIRGLIHGGGFSWENSERTDIPNPAGLTWREYVEREGAPDTASRQARIDKAEASLKQRQDEQARLFGLAAGLTGGIGGGGAALGTMIGSNVYATEKEYQKSSGVAVGEGVEKVENAFRALLDAMEAIAKERTADIDRLKADVTTLHNAQQKEGK